MIAFLYALGFLASRAHLSLLGVSEFSVAHTAYLEEGGRYVLTCIVAMAGDWTVVLRLLAGVTVLTVLHTRMTAQDAGYQGSVAISRRVAIPAIAVSAIVGLGILVSQLTVFFEAAAANDLLLGDGDASEIQQAIRDHDEEVLLGRFTALLGRTIDTGLFIWAIGVALVWLRSMKIRAQFLYGAIFRIVHAGAILVLMIKLLLLPVNYGKLLVPNEFPVVSVTVNGETEPFTKGYLLMLARSEQEVVLYDRENPNYVPNILYLPADEITGLRVLSRESAF